VWLWLTAAEAGYGADMLSHEATFTADMRDKAYIAQHSTATMAGAFARQLNAQTLVLTHFSGRFAEFKGRVSLLCGNPSSGLSPIRSHSLVYTQRVQVPSWASSPIGLDYTSSMCSFTPQLQHSASRYKLRVHDRTLQLQGSAMTDLRQDIACSLFLLACRFS
jgi:hypothetical protein